MLHFEMFERDHHDRTPKTGISIPSELTYLRKIYASNIKNISNYYEGKKLSVQNRNIFSQILDHFDLMTEADFDDFVFVNETDIPRLERTFQFTSTVNKGKAHPPFLYANNGSTIVLSKYNSEGVHNIRKEWRTYPCVEVLYHPRNDLKLLLPNDTDDGSKTGYYVIRINMIALAIKYRCFVMEQMKESENTGTLLTKNVFVSRYVIPGIIESDIDHRMLNRVMGAFYGEPEVTPKFKHPFIIQEPYYKFNKCVNDIVTTLKNKDMLFDNMLRNIPLMTSPDAGQLLTFEAMPENRNVKWAYVVSRLKVMCFLYDIAKNRTMNTDYILSWKRMITQMEADKSMIQSLPYKEETEIRAYMQKIKEMTY